RLADVSAILSHDHGVRHGCSLQMPSPTTSRACFAHRATVLSTPGVCGRDDARHQRGAGETAVAAGPSRAELSWHPEAVCPGRRSVCHSCEAHDAGARSAVRLATQRLDANLPIAIRTRNLAQAVHR